MMKEVICFAMAIILSSALGMVRGAKYQHLNLTDPISKTVISIPEGEVMDSAQNKFQKYRVLTPSSVISVFSMENPENEPFSWKRINEFDKNKKYGSLMSKERLEGRADGWIRYYSTKSDEGQDMINCVSLIRGNGYALYILETAYEKAGLVSPVIVKATEFKPITDHRVNNDGEFGWKTWCVLGGIIALAFLLKTVQKYLSVLSQVIISLVVIGCLFCGMYFCGMFSFAISSSTTGVIAAIWFLIFKISSWDDFWESVEKIISNM